MLASNRPFCPFDITLLTKATRRSVKLSGIGRVVKPEPSPLKMDEKIYPRLCLTNLSARYILVSTFAYFCLSFLFSIITFVGI